MDCAAPALTGDVRSTTADIVAAKAATTEERPDNRSYSQRAEDALLEVIAGAEAVWRRIRQIVTAQPDKEGAVGEDAPILLLLSTPEGFASLMMVTTDALSKAIEGGRQLAVLRAEEAAAVPGVQTVYPPGEGPHAGNSHAGGSQGEGTYPSPAVKEALDQALKKIRERKP
jgi:hypothetical protein